MKRVLLLSMLFLLIVSCADIPVRPVQDFIDEVKEQYAPDTRVTIFDLEYTQKGKVVTLSGEMNMRAGLDSLKQRLQREGYTVLSKVALLPEKELSGKTFGLVKRSVANLRVEPSERSEMASQAVLGTPLRVYKKDRNQYYVQTPDDYLGWMEEDAFTFLTAEEFDAWVRAEKIIYLKDQGYVHEKPKRGSAIMTDITATSVLRAIGPAGDGYVEIELPDGRRGYILRDDCEHLEYWAFKYFTIDAADVIKTAKSFMGRPYLWGGTSTKMMDCSGFTRIVFMLHAIYLPRDASQQALVGETVAEGKEQMDRLKPGNLLFFGCILEDGTERITHTGIYIGNNEFIHESGVVAIESFNPEDKHYSEYRHNQFIRAKNVINNHGKFGVVHMLGNPFYFSEEFTRYATETK